MYAVDDAGRAAERVKLAARARRVMRASAPARGSYAAPHPIIIVPLT